jgi:P27 family predicted phage terminase small subunit
MVKGRMGEPVKNPAIPLRNEAWKRLLRILQEFGLSPASRTRVSSIPASNDDNDNRFFE